MALYAGSVAQGSTLTNLLRMGQTSVYNAGRIAINATGGAPQPLLEEQGFRRRWRRQRYPANPTTEWNRELEQGAQGGATNVVVPIPFKNAFNVDPAGIASAESVSPPIVTAATSRPNTLYFTSD